MNPALRERSGRQRTTSSATESTAAAAIAKSVAATIGRPSVVFAKYALKAPNVITSP